METIASSEFRKLYQHLDEPTRVIANGRPLGVWYPAQVVESGPTAQEPRPVQPAKVVAGGSGSVGPIRRATVAPAAGPVDDIERRRRAQAERDRLLRRMQTH